MTLTAIALAAVLGTELVESAHARKTLEERFASMGMKLNTNQLRQARLPQGAESLPNPRGTAPGLAARTTDGQLLFCLPGPPREYRGMFEEQVLPRLNARRLERGESAPQAYRVFKLFGKGEGAVAESLGDLEAEVPGLILGFRAALPEIHVKLRTEGSDETEVGERLERASTLVRERLGSHVFSEDGRSLPRVVVEELKRQGRTLALAESCTGGMLAKTITDVPGASAVFLLSAVTYANTAKQDILGVPGALLEEHGAVSAPCAEAMATGLRQRSGAHINLSITGIAGPDGGSPDKPVGTVCIAWGSAEIHRVRTHRFPFERERNRTLSAWAALGHLLRALPHLADAPE